MWYTAIIVFGMSHSLHNEIHRITDSDENARDFLFQRGILKSSMSCPGCSSDMNLVPCSSKKSSDLLIWRCSSFSRYRNIGTDSILFRQKLTFPLFLQLVFYLSVKSLENVAISQLIGVSENTVSDWKTLIHTKVADFLMSSWRTWCCRGDGWGKVREAQIQQRSLPRTVGAWSYWSEQR